LPLAALYATVTGLRRWAYRHGWLSSQRLRAVVIVVGNRLAGGTGKTPTVIEIVRQLQFWGWRTGVISRGFGRQGEAVRELHPEDRARDVGDEPLLIARRTGVPVVVGRDRPAAGLELLRRHPDTQVIVCDDGLQHLRLARDLEVVVFDERGLGNGWLLPAGPLRERPTAPSGARRQWVVYNAPAPSTPLPGFMQTRTLSALLPLARWRAGDQTATMDEAVRALSACAGVWAVAGVAVPDKFFAALTGLGLRFTPRALPDHDPWRDWPWPPGVEHVITTEKDAVKIDAQALAHERPGTQVWVACLGSQIEASFWMALRGALDELAPPPTPSA
jgi:tetraacyldisaccharide 4'-kinase